MFVQPQKGPKKGLKKGTRVGVHDGPTPTNGLLTATNYLSRVLRPNGAYL